MAFYDDVIFPVDISYGSQGGPRWNTEVVITNSGREVRNQRWVNTRYTFDVSYGVKTPEQMYDLIELFHAVRGMAHGFNYVDPLDNNSTSVATALADIGTSGDTSYLDQNLGTGDGTTATYQLRKLYVTAAQTYYRTIKKTIAGTVLLGIGGVEVTEDWTVSEGLITIEDRSATVTAVTTGATTDINLSTASGLSVGGSIYIAGVGGVTGINDTRHSITNISGSVVTVSTSTSGTYTSGGTSETLPQSGEAVTAGYEFYVPVRFNTDTLSSVFNTYRSLSTSVELVEVRT